MSLELHRGDIKVIIGPSGSGKSTLLHCINFLVELRAGPGLAARRADRPVRTSPSFTPTGRRSG
ncbi:MAG: ATP-binding cassette domain-containing protein [Desulfomicrobium escambiense]|nr:ATP-binding cassette domain-containing protein [Desulfomicrobium escambiense]